MSEIPSLDSSPKAPNRGSTKSSPARIRPARPTDLLALAEIEAAAFASASSPAWHLPALKEISSRKSSRTFVAEASEATASVDTPASVGYGLFQLVMDEAELLRIAVMPAHGDRGIGSQLLAHALERLGDEGISTCHLEVRVDNLAALALYSHHGFEEVGRRRRYYRDGSDAVLLRSLIANCGRC